MWLHVSVEAEAGGEWQGWPGLQSRMLRALFARHPHLPYLRVSLDPGPKKKIVFAVLKR